MSGVGSIVSSFCSRVSSLGFRVSGFGFRVSGVGVGFRVSGFGFRDTSPPAPVEPASESGVDPGVPDCLGFAILGVGLGFFLWFGVWWLGFRV